MIWYTTKRQCNWSIHQTILHHSHTVAPDLCFHSVYLRMNGNISPMETCPRCLVTMHCEALSADILLDALLVNSCGCSPNMDMSEFLYLKKYKKAITKAWHLDFFCFALWCSLIDHSQEQKAVAVLGDANDHGMGWRDGVNDRVVQRQWFSRLWYTAWINIDTHWQGNISALRMIS